MEAVEDVGVVVNEATEIVERQRYAFEEVGFALVEAAVAVGTEGLEYAHEDVMPEALHEVRVAVERDVVLQQLVAEGLGEVALGAVEERGDVVLCGAESAALVVDVVEGVF